MRQTKKASTINSIPKPIVCNEKRVGRPDGAGCSGVAAGADSGSCAADFSVSILPGFVESFVELLLSSSAVFDSIRAGASGFSAIRGRGSAGASVATGPESDNFWGEAERSSCPARLFVDTV